MRMDTAIVSGDLPGILALLETAQGRGLTMISNRVQRAAKMFESCKDEGLRQSFLVSCLVVKRSAGVFSCIS